MNYWFSSLKDQRIVFRTMALAAWKYHTAVWTDRFFLHRLRVRPWKVNCVCMESIYCKHIIIMNTYNHLINKQIYYIYIYSYEESCEIIELFMSYRFFHKKHLRISTAPRRGAKAVALPWVGEFPSGLAGGLGTSYDLLRRPNGMRCAWEWDRPGEDGQNMAMSSPKCLV